MVQGSLKKKPAGNSGNLVKRYVNTYLPTHPSNYLSKIEIWGNLMDKFHIHQETRWYYQALKANLCELLCSPSALGPKRGPRQIAPKKTTLVKQQKLTKVFSFFLSFSSGDLSW